MMRCSDLRSVSDAYLDDELTPFEIARVQEHLAGCDGCRADLQAAAALHAALTADAMTDAPPQMLGHRILERVAADAADRGPDAVHRRVPAAVVAAAALAGILLVLLVLFPVGAGPTAGEFVPPHRDVLEPASPLADVPADAGLQGWLGRHLGDGVIVPTATADGERIVGGRVSAVAGHDVVQLLYQGEGRRLSLFISKHPVRRQREEVEHVVEGVDVYTSAVEGNRIGWWQDGPLTYVVVGAVETSDVLEFALRCVQSRRPT